MANPQKQLFQLLAQVNEQRKACDRIGQDAKTQSSKAQSGLLPSITELRQRIELVGVGADPEAEDEYLEALRSFRRLGQVAQVEPVDTDVSGELAKTLRITSLYKSVYGDEASLRKTTDSEQLRETLW